MYELLQYQEIDLTKVDPKDIRYLIICCEKNYNNILVLSIEADYDNIKKIVENIDRQVYAYKKDFYLAEFYPNLAFLQYLNMQSKELLSLYNLLLLDNIVKYYKLSNNEWISEDC